MNINHQNKRRKLTDAQREQARQMARQKCYTYDQIARQFGVSIGYISKLAKGDDKR